MIIYNVTVKIEQSLANDWVEWMKSKHIPDVIATGLFSTYRLCRIFEDDADGGMTFATQYFCNNLDRKKTFMLNNFFCFYDVVDSLIISCDDDNSLDEYVNNKIFNNFLDQNVFKSKTRDYYPISIKRVYNQKVIELLNTGKIKKVIHTMGNNTITKGFETNPKENNEKIGFQKYIDFIKAICESRNITFVEESYSPSQYAIKTKKVEIKTLDKWISDNVLNK